MSLIDRLIISNYENNLIPLTYLDNIMKVMSEFLNNPTGKFELDI